MTSNQSPVGTYEYDQNGNMTCRIEDGVTFKHTYNTENRISSIAKVDGDCSSVDVIESWSYLYDGDGVRVQEDYFVEITLTSTKKYYFGGMYETRSDSTVIKYYSFNGQTIAMNDGNGLKYFLTDHLGSTVAILDDEGTLIEQQRYLPFGGERTDISLPVVSTDFTYTGQRNLDGTGLMDYKFRMYSPLLGRFISPDDIIPHIDRPQTWNRYSYVYNRPINLNDPTGHCGDCILDIGFILMDLAFIAKEGWTPVNTAALVADVVAAFVPVATGAGLAIRGISRGAAVAEGAVRIPAVLRGVQVIEKIGQMFMATTNNGGENQYTRRGKQAHKNYRNALGEGYDFEQVLPSGKRVDAINEEERIVRELKPDNPRAIARGLTQVKKYAEELSRITGKIWKYFVDTYKR